MYPIYKNQGSNLPFDLILGVIHPNLFKIQVYLKIILKILTRLVKLLPFHNIKTNNCLLFGPTSDLAGFSDYREINYQTSKISAVVASVFNRGQQQSVD